VLKKEKKVVRKIEGRQIVESSGRRREAICVEERKE
jgi:hypothetical protein